MGGLWLRADDPRFGGLSDLRVSADGERVVAVSDCGSGLTARLSYDDAGRLAGLADARLVALTDSAGGALAATRSTPRAWSRPRAASWRSGSRAAAGSRPTGPGSPGPRGRSPRRPALAECGSNGGLELMADVGDGRRLLVCEERRSARRDRSRLDRRGATPGRSARTRSTSTAAGPASRSGPPPRRGFRTGTCWCSSGASRRSPRGSCGWSGARSRASGPLEPREIARLEPPLTLDNFEGVEVRQDAARAARSSTCSRTTTTAPRPRARRAATCSARCCCCSSWPG